MSHSNFNFFPYINLQKFKQNKLYDGNFFITIIIPDFLLSHIIISVQNGVLKNSYHVFLHLSQFTEFNGKVTAQLYLLRSDKKIRRIFILRFTG